MIRALPNTPDALRDELAELEAERVVAERHLRDAGADPMGSGIERARAVCELERLNYLISHRRARLARMESER